MRTRTRIITERLLLRSEVAVPIMAAECVRTILLALRGASDAGPALAAANTNEGQEVVGPTSKA